MNAAVSDIDSHLKIHPSSLKAYHLKSKIALANNNIPLAKKNLYLAFNLNPAYTPGLALYGEILLREKKVKEANTYLSKAIKQNPNDLEAYGNRAFLRKMQKDYIGALADLNQEIILNPKRAEAYLLRAEVFVLLNKPAKAKRDLDKAISLNNSSFQSFLQAGKLFFLLKEYVSAIDYFNYAISLDPKSAEAYSWNCSANKILKNELEARKNCEIAQSLKKSDQIQIPSIKLEKEEQRNEFVSPNKEKIEEVFPEEMKLLNSGLATTAETKDYSFYAPGMQRTYYHEIGTNKEINYNGENCRIRTNNTLSIVKAFSIYQSGISTQYTDNNEYSYKCQNHLFAIYQIRINHQPKVEYIMILKEQKLLVSKIINKKFIFINKEFSIGSTPFSLVSDFYDFQDILEYAKGRRHFDITRFSTDTDNMEKFHITLDENRKFFKWKYFSPNGTASTYDFFFSKKSDQLLAFGSEDNYGYLQKEDLNQLLNSKELRKNRIHILSSNIQTSIKDKQILMDKKRNLKEIHFVFNENKLNPIKWFKDNLTKRIAADKVSLERGEINFLLKTPDQKEIQELMASDAYLQSDSENVISLVKEITNQEQDKEKIAILLAQWIFENIKYDTSNSINMDTFTILETKTGDCSEMSRLLVSFLRAAKIPSMQIHGMVFDRDRMKFIGHAWVAAYFNGKWFEFEATNGSRLNDYEQHIPDLYDNRIEKLEIISSKK